MRKLFNKIKKEDNSKDAKRNAMYEDSGIGNLNYLQAGFAVAAIAFFIFSILFYRLYLQTQGSYLRATAEDLSTTAYGCLGFSFLFSISTLLMLPVKTIVKAAYLYVKEHEAKQKENLYEDRTLATRSPQ